MTRAVQIAELGDQSVFTIDSSNNRVGIGSTQPTNKLDVNDGAITVGTGITIDSVSGVISATKFVGPMEGTLTGNISGTSGGLSGSPDITITNLTGVAATFSGNVNVSGTLTYEDVTNIDSVGIITAQSHVSIADSILHTGDTDTSIRFPAANTFTVETAGSERVRVDSSGRLLVGTTSNSANVRSVFQANSANSAGAGIVQIARGNTFTAADTNIGNLEFTDSGANVFARIQCESDAGVAAGSDHPGRITFETTADGSSSPSERLRITSTGGVHFNNAELIERVNIVANKLSAAPNINLDNGMIHHFTTAETTTATPNIISTAGINTNMAVGDAMSVTIVTTAAAAGYAATVHIDGLPLSNNSGSLNWTGGTAPSAGGSSGVDIYAYTIIKTASAKYTAIASLTKTSA